MALTRKNALFAGNEIGAENWAMLASLVIRRENSAPRCFLVRLILQDVRGEPGDYIAATLRAILDGHPQCGIEDLMPWRFQQPSSLAA